MPNYPRRAKIARSAATSEPESGLPKLTAKQEQFALAILEGKQVGEAYRLAYDCSNMGANSIAVEATRLARNTKIALYIRFCQRIGLENQQVSRENHLAELARLRELAVENQQVSAGVQAEHYRGRVAGLYNDKLTIGIGPSDDAILSQLASLLGPELALAVGKSLKGETGTSEPLEPSSDNSILSLPAPYDTTD